MTHLSKNPYLLFVGEQMLECNAFDKLFAHVRALTLFISIKKVIELLLLEQPASLVQLT